MFNGVKNISSRTIVIGYTLSIFLLIVLISAGIYIIDTRNQALQQAINKQFTVNSTMKKLTEISRYRGEIMLTILDEEDPFNRDDLIQDYNAHTREFLKYREKIIQLNLSKTQTDIFDNSMKKVGAAYEHQVETIRLVNDENIIEAKKLFSEEIWPKKIKIRDSYDELISSMQLQAKIEIDEAQRISRTTMIVTIALLALLFILAIWIQYLATNAIRKFNMLLIVNNEKLELTVSERTKELNLAKDVAEKSNKEKSVFLAGTSHELRTPLNGILGFGQLLEMDENLDDNQKENIEGILIAGRHLISIINELLNLHQIESGQVKVFIEKSPLNTIVEQCLILIASQASSHKVNVVNNIGDNDYIILADVMRMTQILINLLSNAIKYGDDASDVILDCDVDEENNLYIRVTDSSKGLSKEEIDKLFTSFERLDASSQVEGTGLGLVICKSLIEVMEGSIGVDSSLGKGSTFWVKIPLSTMD